VQRFTALLLSALGAALAAPAAASAVCSQRPAAAHAMTGLREALQHGRFVAYQPTSLTVVDGRVTAADAAGIRADLAVLRPYFDSLITYDAVHGAESIPAIAASLKFRALIIGIWDPLSDAEVEAAVTAARAYPRLVVGVSLGNELLFSRRAEIAALDGALKRLHGKLPQLPLTTSEPFHIYYQEPLAPLLGELDFLLANVHPVFQPWFRDAPDEAAARFVVSVVDKLATAYCGPILVKETGVPTAPASAGFSEVRQAAFYLRLREEFPPTRERAFAYFSAFDAPWRVTDATGVPGPHPQEAHWGLYDAARRPKAAARALPRLTSRPSRP
jgi:exo-beta-1,3-glucanase (GH17 family)